VTAFIEIVPSDTVKYELDKASGHLRIDRPQRYSCACPTLYGFVPQTYCAERVAARCQERTSLSISAGDGDPLDICVLTERPFPMGNFLLTARPIGGLRLVDRSEADDKIIAVLEADAAYGDLTELAQCPPRILERLRHYFLSYKQIPGEQPIKIEIAEVYDRPEACETIRRSLDDYRAHFARE
jgi:inorganic pyrophosphatase